MEPNNHLPTPEEEESCSPDVVQLGFCISIEDSDHLRQVAHRNPDYTAWDGGQVGGRPVWLNPEHVPSKVTCRACHPNEANNNKGDLPQMRFVCQLYAPVDFAADDDRAFHRSLYVFACPRCCGTRHSSSQGNYAGIRVLRAQLPAQNPYFPNQEGPQSGSDDGDDDVIEEVNWQQHLPASWNTHVCAVCGLAATGKCPLQQAYFCGPRHQREYKLYVHGNDKMKTKMKTNRHGEEEEENDDVLATNSLAPLPSVYHMTELVVEEEPPPSSDNNHSGNVPCAADSEDDSDAELEQDDLNQMVSGVSTTHESTTTAAATRTTKVHHDPVTMAFYQRLQERPNVRQQCLRYSRWKQKNGETNTAYKRSGPQGHADTNHPDDDAGPLWIRQEGRCPNDSSHDDGSAIPACENCGGPRQFEFQLLPQMLHYLLQNRPERRKQKNTKKTGQTDAAAAAGQTENGGTDDLLSNYETVKQALQQTESLIQQAPPEQIPPALIQAKEAAVKRVQQELLGVKGRAAVQGTTTTTTNGTDQDNNNDGNDEDDREIDWGVVAVYTCVNSCSSRRRNCPGEDGNSTAAHDGELVLDPNLGSYLEEFAWVQTSLDAVE